jgi:NhaP-type Na+/H+ or K+/H+ antiporter
MLEQVTAIAIGIGGAIVGCGAGCTRGVALGAAKALELKMMRNPETYKAVKISIVACGAIVGSVTGGFAGLIAGPSIFKIGSPFPKTKEIVIKDEI